MRKRVCSILAICLIIPFLIILVIDYFDLPSAWGLHMSNINKNFFSAFFNSVVVIGLYIITYIVIDKRQIQKDKNAELTAYVLMKSSYIKCKDCLEMINNQKLLSEYIVPEIDFNKTNSENLVTMNLLNNPFMEYEPLLKLSVNGSFSHNDLNDYLKVMEMYKSYISMRITFFDIEQSMNPEHIEIAKKLHSNKKELDIVLHGEIKKIQNLLGETRCCA